MSNSWTISNPIEQSIKEKIERYGTPLSQCNIDINYGIKTGYNDAFIIDGTTKDKLISEDPKSAEIIRPILRGRDIKRYGYEFKDLYLICTFPSKNIDIENFPAIKKYLLTFGIEKLEQTGKIYTINGKKIKARKKTHNKWFETQDSIAYWDDFNKPKLMYSEIVQSPRFYFDRNGEFYPEATTFIMTGKEIEYLYYILNSSIMFKIFSKFYAGGGLGEKGIRYKKAFLTNLPVPRYSNFEDVSTILDNLNINEIESQIEKHIMKFFSFTDEEINYLNKN